MSLWNICMVFKIVFIRYSASEQYKGRSYLGKKVSIENGE